MESTSGATARALLGEDYALARVPETDRRSLISVSQVGFAVSSALVFVATGGGLWQLYGTGPLILGVVLGAAIVGIAAYVLTSFACECGLDSDLMSIWAGYGVRGSAVSSLIYSSNYAILFALEDSILADAVHQEFPWWPKWAALLVLGALVITLTWYGVQRLARVATITLVPLLALMVWMAAEALSRTPHGGFWSFNIGQSISGAPDILAVVASLLAFVVDAPIGGDLGRFLRPEDRKRGALLLGFGLQIVCFGGVIMLGAWLTYRLGGLTNPGVYLVSLAGIVGLVSVLLSQTRINLINDYVGSLSLSNFAFRLLTFRPGRRIWTVVIALIATGLAIANLYGSLLSVLRFDAVFVAGWTSTLVTYVLMSSPRRRLVACTVEIEEMGADHRSLISLLIALAFGVPLTFGAGGIVGEDLAPLVSIGVASAGVIISSLVLQRRADGMEGVAM